MPTQMLHLDIKTGNVLINNAYEAKIADIGSAKWKCNTTVYADTFSEFYAAPEVRENRKVMHIYRPLLHNHIGHSYITT